MQVHAIVQGDLAACLDARGRPCAQPVQTALLDSPPAPGDWLLVHVDTAIRVLDAMEARHIADALEAVDRAARGEAFEHLIADLIDREPQLPEHLRVPVDEQGRPTTSNSQERPNVPGA
jgi:hydrogenase expression/formation protein HypC